MNNDDKVLTIVLAVMFFAFVSFVFCASVRPETCSVCKKDYRHVQIIEVKGRSGVKFKVCKDCLWNAFKDQIN